MGQVGHYPTPLGWRVIVSSCSHSTILLTHTMLNGQEHLWADPTSILTMIPVTQVELSNLGIRPTFMDHLCAKPSLFGQTLLGGLPVSTKPYWKSTHMPYSQSLSPKIYSYPDRSQNLPQLVSTLGELIRVKIISFTRRQVQPGLPIHMFTVFWVGAPKQYSKMISYYYFLG